MQNVMFFASFFAFVLFISVTSAEPDDEESAGQYRLMNMLIDNAIMRAMESGRDVQPLAEKRDYFRKCQLHPISCFGRRK